ncbi:MAG TPA: UDP-N-acetylmuramate--L-alanine ligase [Candidatus Limnocylindrales bacterium]|nr:UDP-N-acetylmuramate--L-alanine ligase [Candidatus Limnocylindrales bacterium]
MTLDERFDSGPAWSSLKIPADGAEGTTAPARHLGRIHLVGIGGIGMSGIAEVLLTLGYTISGSDLSDNDTTRHLRELGAEIWLGHDASHIGSDINVVVISSAVSDDNPEVRAAREHRVPVIPRAEMLAELMRVKCTVGVAGAHGKTTTTSLVAAVLSAGGLDPTLVIGGRLKSLGGTNARLGRSRYMVVEADESDGSFLLLRPTLAVVTNIDREHMNFYGDMEVLRTSYLAYINAVPFYGKAVLCLDCPEIRALLPKVRKPHLTYGTSPEADLRATGIQYHGLSSSFDVTFKGAPLGRVNVAMPGEHAVRNALAALVVGMDFGLDFQSCAAALAGFEGVMRRFEIKGEAAGVTVVDDYGHHPTEVCATLRAARLGYPDRRIVAVFQPHRFSRLADLFDLFAECFEDADAVVLTDVYAAGESPIEGYDGRRLAEAAGRIHPGEVVFEGAGADLALRVAARIRPGDLVLTLGAGDVTKLGPLILQELQALQQAQTAPAASRSGDAAAARPKEHQPGA